MKSTPAPAAPTSATVVGAVSELYQGDLDAGRHVLEALAREPLGDDVLVEDFSYGAVAVAQRLEEIRPRALVLVGAARRGRRAAAVERREIVSRPVDPVAAQRAIADAVTGYVSIDLVLDVAHALGVLPQRTVAIEVEPVTTASSERLSPEVEGALEALVRLVRDEVAP